MMITSPANPRLKAIRKLRERKARQESGLFYAEGLRIVVEAVQQSAQIETLVTAPQLLDSPVGQRLAADFAAAGGEVLELSAEAFQAIALKDDPVGIAAVIHQNWVSLSQVSVQPDELWIALDEAADPGNLGTILRTSDAIGGSGVILLDHCTDPYDPTAIRASMGALFSQRLVKAQLGDFAAWKQAHGFPLVGTSGAACTDYQELVYPSGVVLLMGSEREGLSEAHLGLCDAVVRIPMVGRSDSLNLAVATALVAYEVFNQKRRKTG